MKHGGDYARRLKHLFHRLVRKFGKPAPLETSDPLEQMVIAILGGNTSHHKALLAFRKLREQMVDLNELRVTPVTELARVIGPAIPQAEAKAQRIVVVLNDIRRRHDTLDLSFLKQRGRREAREYLESLEGVDRATAASVTLYSLGGHAIPVDELTLQVLRKDEVVDPAADLAEVQSFLEHHIGASDALAFSQLLDRYVASRGMRLPEDEADEPADRVASEGGRPEKKPGAEAPASAPSREVIQSVQNGEAKSGSDVRHADPPRKAAAPLRSSPVADRHSKSAAGRAATKSGKAGRRR